MTVVVLGMVSFALMIVKYISFILTPGSSGRIIRRGLNKSWREKISYRLKRDGDTHQLSHPVNMHIRGMMVGSRILV